jgi:hypothetical protein
MSLTMNDLYSINRAGEECEPHRYKDGNFRAARYRSDDEEWKNKDNYIIFAETELGMMLADAELYIRMSPIRNRENAALFKTSSILRRP